MGLSCHRWSPMGQRWANETYGVVGPLLAHRGSGHGWHKPLGRHWPMIAYQHLLSSVEPDGPTMGQRNIWGGGALVGPSWEWSRLAHGRISTFPVIGGARWANDGPTQHMGWWGP